MAKDTKKFKSAPNSKESEMMVLGCMLTNINSLNAACDSLIDTEFYYIEHQIIFKVIYELYKKDKPADIHIVSEELKRLEKLTEIGGISYLTTLAQYAGTSAFIEEYINLVKEKAVLRQMIDAAQSIEKKAIEEAQDVSSLLDEAQTHFFRISQSTGSNDLVNLKDLIIGTKGEAKLPYLKILEDRQEKYQQLGEEGIKVVGIPTHFIDVDKLINGFSPSNLMILAARPAMGKCVTGDTLILNPQTGQLVKIEDIVRNKKGTVLTFNQEWKFNKTSPSAFVADGVKPTFKIKTGLGREIQATAAHPLLTIEGWKSVKDLSIGERIATPSALPFFGNSRMLDYEIKILAYLIADGCLTKKPPEFTNVNSKIVQDFKEAARSFDPIEITEKIRSDRVPGYSVVLNRRPLNEMKEKFATALEALTVSARKKVNSLVKQNDLSLALVYHCVEASALPSATIGDIPSQEFPNLPSLSDLIRSNPITEFLKKFKLLGKNAHQKTIPDKIFTLKKENIALFINRLFSCDGTAYLAKSDNSLFPVIAYSSVSKKLIYQIQHLLLRFCILSKIRKKQTSASYELEVYGKENITKFCEEIGIFGKEDAVRRVYEHVSCISKNDPKLNQMADSDIYWDKIVSIVPSGEKEVYDLTIDQTHNFIANDLIVHNTALALNIAENICFKNEIPVGIFSLEMSAEQLLHRIICSQSEVESEKILTGSLNGHEYQRIVACINSMQKHTLLIDDHPGLKITDLRARARRMKESYNIGFLVIDYLQLISGSGSSRSMESRQIEISEISRMMKNLARELNIPVLCLSQLSRKVEERHGHRPMMSDLRESGCLSKDTQIKNAETGELHTIEELAKRKSQTPIYIFGIDENLNLGKHKLTKAFYSGKKTVYKLTTRSGRSIKASANHPFKTSYGWTRLDKLTIGLLIVVYGEKINTEKENTPSILFNSSNSGSLAVLERTKSQTITSSYLYWDEISSIEKLGVEDVYDATVESVHNFVANDIIVHNSLEQDSDLVMFLLRPEYYDPYDKPNQGELIIAKNRHGAVGSVNLTFRKEIAQFANYTPTHMQTEEDNEEAFSAFSPKDS